MVRYIFTICCIFILSVTHMGYAYTPALVNIPEELHVFIEGYATNPAFLQMIQYVQLPKDTRKIIAWHRFPDRKNILDLDMNNTREVSLKRGEGCTTAT